MAKRSLLSICLTYVIVFGFMKQCVVVKLIHCWLIIQMRWLQQSC